MWMLVTYLFFVMLVGGTLPTPLYPIYTRQLGLSSFTITVIFAVYALGVLATLLTCGKLSDKVGRKAILIPGLLIAAASSLIFIAADGLPLLLLGRVVSGMSVGLTVGAATAYLTDLHPDKARAALIATVANMLGLGSGALLSGVLAEYGVAPTILPYGVFLALLLPGLLLIFLPETVPVQTKRGGIQFQRPRVPPAIRLPFAAVSTAAFSAFAFLGLFSALAGKFLATGLQRESSLLVGVVAFAAFGAAAFSQLLALRLQARRGMVWGLAAIPVALAMVITALPIGSTTLFLAGTLLGGAGSGIAFKAALGVIAKIAPADRIGEVTSGFFLLSYLGLTVPVIGLGAMIMITPLITAAASFGIALSLTVIGSILLSLRFLARQP